jgi:hypothetical protein
MLAPQPIPVSFSAARGVAFFVFAGAFWAGALWEGDEVWPFTSKVCAELAVAAIRIASLAVLVIPRRTILLFCPRISLRTVAHCDP